MSSLLAVAAITVPAVTVHAQVKGPNDPSASPTSATSSSGKEDLIELSPFNVNTEKDRGFMAVNAGTATKLGVDMKDLAAPYSVMTGEFIKTMGITDIRSAVYWSTGGSQVFDGQGSDPFGLNGGGTSTTSTMYSIRGVTLNAGQQRNFFLTGGLGDTYNIERIDFGRGPNAVLFNVGANSVLGGGISTQGKRARLDRNFTTVGFIVGSWDYYRGTVDTNQVLNDRLAVRLNLMGQKKNGWMQDEFENRQGITLAGTYKITSKTELRAEVISDRTQRATVPFPYFDNLSGWNGSTVFNGPVSDQVLNGLVATANGTTLATGRGPAGSSEGVDRQSTRLYVYDPLTNTVQDWIHTGITRRGDVNEWTPIYFGDTVWSRNGNANILPIGNSNGSSAGNRTPGVNENGNVASFLDTIDLPSNRFDRQVANSKFQVPSRQFSAMPDMPLFTQNLKDANLALTHSFTDDLFLEVAGDFNTMNEYSSNSHLNLRFGYIDINQTLPNGAPNPNFLKAYSQSNATVNYRQFDNWGVRANLGWVKNLGIWGNYTFNLAAALSGRESDSRTKVLSVGLSDPLPAEFNHPAGVNDPRQWHAGNELITIRNYWDGSYHPSFFDIKPTSLFERTPTTTGSGAAATTTYTTSSTPIEPRWVLSDWARREETTRSLILAFAGRYFGDRLIVMPGVRNDRQSTYIRNRPANWGDLPDDPQWDGVTLDDNYWRPDAPTDWTSYLIGNRPTLGGANDVNRANPAANDKRYRGDYNNPKSTYNVWNKTLGITYHALSWAAVKLNYGESYLPGAVARYTLDGHDAGPEEGKAYEAAVTFNFFSGNLAITPRYYHNLQLNRLGFLPGNPNAIDSLMGRRAWNDSNSTGRNPFGFSNVLGSDTFSTKNDGTELEVAGNITRGWRLMANFGTAQATDRAGRLPNTPAYVLGRVDEYRQVLEAAGGIIDTTRKPVNGGHTIDAAPGVAIANPAITNAMIQAAGGDTNVRTGAVNDYNKIWTDYDNLLLQQKTETIGNKYMRINVYTDYTIQTGASKGLSVGLGWQYSDQVVAGYYSAQTIANPNYNPNLPVSLTNLQYVDDPSVDINTPVYAKRPSEFTLTVGYARKLPKGWGMFANKEASLQLTVHNLTNQKNTFYQDDGIANRPPGGDPNLGYRETVVNRVALYQRPINFELQASLTF
ncbi:MAG TPA: TonB-dependent receptor plug domain-containing protein [Opitutaceae bacterium]|nr:TonB-dependent receptor plug domain-containing protein [Opitutaceae bacterium]